ncbi:DUF397 domain-containing protein [Streptomyces himalayensis]|uniref:DUF397 domain-containing protein n=1 Tax=Streptomyces himalayensis subsp. himalayensis TaxID=2756131 RepID=A0A7W0DRG3_9ACTN|nr:DUF397 domain-containing protein [Streptomyces himalayensis]MBA2949902.1 DUF397 domain-containing protein [Streptomyces himalayensis subsp. himalayensis]
MRTEQSTARPLRWFKSSYSGGDGGECIEVAACPSAIHIRDSKDTTRASFTVSPAAWSSFLALTRQG